MIDIVNNWKMINLHLNLSHTRSYCFNLGIVFLKYYVHTIEEDISTSYWTTLNVQFLFQKAFESLWIGAHFSYGQWVWMATGTILNAITDTRTGYPPWSTGQSKRSDGCLLFDRHHGDIPQFMETNCDRKRDFVCEECKLLHTILIIPFLNIIIIVVKRTASFFSWKDIYP